MTAPRENGWEELRREIEALKADRGDAEWDTVARQEVLAIVDRLAAARGEPPTWQSPEWGEIIRLVSDGMTLSCDNPECGGYTDHGNAAHNIVRTALGERLPWLATPTTPEPDPDLLCPDCVGTGYVRHSGDMHFRVAPSAEPPETSEEGAAPPGAGDGE